MTEERKRYTTGLKSVNTLIASLSNMQPDKIASLYPMVKENEAPLPRQWNSKDKFQHLHLSNANLRVSYRGPGKCQKDAAAVRTTHPIPACGFYYFEIKVVNKGKDGYIGVGLCHSSVNLNRLPGWDKHSWGYHGDDGHSFNSSGTGKPYGPVFASGDVIGCGLDFVNNACFYTKNGTNLGNVFFNLPKALYPTVGLQSPNEVVEANFGQHPFVFDFEGYRKELVSAVERQILDHPLPCSLGKWDETVQRLTTDYLIHYGYHAAALDFARLTGQNIDEQIASMKNRQQIQQLVLNGRVEEAISLTNALYPKVFAIHRDLLFRLKIRQFIDLILTVNFDALTTSTQPSSVSDVAQRQQQERIAAGPEGAGNESTRGRSDEFANIAPTGALAGEPNEREDSPPVPSGERNTGESMEVDVDDVEPTVYNNASTSNAMTDPSSMPPSKTNLTPQDEKQEFSKSMDSLTIEKALALGRELYAICSQLGGQVQDSSIRMMREAFSLLAYKDLSTAPMAYLLDPVDREPVSAALNSAILSAEARSAQPPLNLLLQYAVQYERIGSRNYVGSSAFATPQFVADYVMQAYPATAALQATSSMDASDDH